MVKEITGGSLDYLINNAAVVSHVSEFKTFGDLYVLSCIAMPMKQKEMLTGDSDDDFDAMEKDLLESLEINLLAVIKSIHAFVPLIRNGKGKKVITISTGMSDLDLINSTEVAFASPYAISKGAVNVAIAKYNALYNKEGILFLAISPGYVTTERNTGRPKEAPAEKNTHVGRH